MREHQELPAPSRAVESVSARDVDPLDAFKYMYAELPLELIEQREEFRAALKREANSNGR